ncbi:glycoside hydrolase [bacterium]|nr:glycoside hydrolase [bacterium]
MSVAARFSLLFRCTFTALTALCVLSAPVHAQSPDNEIVLRIDPTPEYPRNSEGSFVTLGDGSILYAYTQFYGGAADHGAARIAGIESRDGGATWSAKPRVIVENYGDQNVMSVSFLRLRSGKIALFYIVKNSFHDCRPCMQVSTDEGKTWSEPRMLFETPGYFVLNNDRVIQLSEGRLIVPVAFHRSIYRKGQKDMDYRAIDIWYLSDDEGETWYEADTWWAAPAVTTSGLQEPGVVELSDGALFSWSRTDLGCQYGCRSTDRGKTWTAPEPTSLISPVSPASIKMIPGTSDLLAVYNDHSGRFPFAEKRRNPLVVAISKDGGKTWPIAKMIESDLDGHFCYTAIHFTGDSVLLAYCAGSLTNKDMYGLNPHRIRKIRIDWLYK